VKLLQFTFLENGTISSPCFSMLGFAALGILEKSPPCNRAEGLVAEEGLELVVVFRGKSYILSAAGDKLGIISAREKR